MCLSVLVYHPECLLNRGEHLGHEWVVTHNGNGYRCGYVKVLPGHPWFGLPWDDVPAEVHGGLTFSKADEPCDAAGPDDGWWVGFDCGHSGDAQDPELPGYTVSIWPMLGSVETIKTQEYAEAECIALCEQAAEVAV